MEPSLEEVMAGTEPEPETPPPEPVTPDKPVEVPETPETPAKDPEPVVVRDDQGRFKGADKPVEKAPVAALLEERRRRQELETQLKAAKAEPKTSFFDDADKAFQERMSEAMAPLQARFFRLSVRQAEGAHKDDFESAVNAFSEAADKDPRLIQQLRDADDPGEFAYTIGLQIKELGDVGGDLSKYRDKVTGDFKVKLEESGKRIAALEAELATFKQTDLAKVPRSLNTLQSGANPKGTDAAPDDLKQITRFGKLK